jgi:hypothetical protein
MFHVAGEFMAFLAFDIIYPDLGLKEGIDLGPQSFCKHARSG